MQFLLNLFVKNNEDVTDPAVREACGKLGGIVGIISNVLLCTAKIIVGVISNSIAIIADGINNLTDAASSIITVLGFKFASMPADEEHPYGHARIEYLAGLFISFGIIIVGVQLFLSSVQKIRQPEPAEYTAVTIVILVAAIAIKLWQSYFNINLGKHIDSLTLIAAGIDSRNDVIATAAVLVSVMISKFAGVYTDGWMGCAVAVFIIWSGISLVRETISPLLGEAPAEELVQDITERILNTDGVLGIHDIMVHNYGPGKIFATVHVEVSAEQDIMESHDMVDNIEREISEALNISLVIHTDPVKTDDPLLNRLRDIITQEVAGISGVCDMHDFRIGVGPTHTNIIFDLVRTPECTLKESEIKARVDKRLQKEPGKYFTVITFDKVYTKVRKDPE